jgi:hypothetical protein
MTELAYNDLLAFIEIARANPTVKREYRVVWGTGELLAAGSADDNEVTIKETLATAKHHMGINYLSRW